MYNYFIAATWILFIAYLIFIICKGHTLPEPGHMQKIIDVKIKELKKQKMIDDISKITEVKK